MITAPSSHVRHFALCTICLATLWLSGCASDSSKTAPIISLIDNGLDLGALARAPSPSIGLSTAVEPQAIDQPTTKTDDSQLSRFVYYGFDSYVIKEHFHAAIHGHANRLIGAPSLKVLIEGHTDERGSREYNLALGQRRAEAIQRSLSLLGVKADQIEAVSFGEERPAAQGSGEEVWAKNRRAEIKDRK